MPNTRCNYTQKKNKALGFGAITLLSTLTVAFPAKAMNLTWILNDVTFNDGDTATGTFDYDPETNEYAMAKITTDSHLLVSH